MLIFHIQYHDVQNDADNGSVSFYRNVHHLDYHNEDRNESYHKLSNLKKMSIITKNY